MREILNDFMISVPLALLSPAMKRSRPVLRLRDRLGRAETTMQPEAKILN